MNYKLFIIFALFILGIECIGLRSCPNSCSNNGDCDAEGFCHCKYGFTEPDCSLSFPDIWKEYELYASICFTILFFPFVVSGILVFTYHHRTGKKFWSLGKFISLVWCFGAANRIGFFWHGYICGREAWDNGSIEFIVKTILYNSSVVAWLIGITAILIHW